MGRQLVLTTLQMPAFNRLRVWPHYFGPARNVLSSDGIGRASEPARDAQEIVPTRPVPFVDGLAARALPACVARVDCDERNAAKLRFVRNESAKLVERPSVMRAPLRPANRYPIADALEVFEGNTACGAFGLAHDRLRDAVIDGGNEALLARPAFPQKPLGALGPFLLKPLSQAMVSVTKPVQVPAAECLAIAISRNVDNTEINAKPTFRVERLRLGHVARADQEPLATDVGEVGLALPESEHRLLPFSGSPRNLKSAFDRPQADDVILHETEDAIVVRLRPVLPKGRCALPADFEGVSHFGDAPNRCLGGKPKLKAQIAIGKLVKVVLPEHSGVKTLRRKPSARSVAALKRRFQGDGLFGGGQELHLGNQFHPSSIEHPAALRNEGVGSAGRPDE